MNKAQLVARIAADAGVSKIKAGVMLNVVTHTIMQLLENGKKINLVGLGIFSVTWHASRMGRHPQTGDPLRIKAKRKIRFKTGFELSDALNEFAAKHSRIEHDLFKEETIWKRRVG
jgi:DNA-binding protein HU-beta